MKIFTRIARIIRDVTAVVTEASAVHRELQRRRAEQAPVPAPLSADDITGDIPEPADIEAAARTYERARLDTNAAARTKRLAEKILKRTPDGTYGAVTVERYESARSVIDADAVRAVFEAHGLGDVPMKRCAPSLTLTFADTLACAA